MQSGGPAAGHRSQRRGHVPVPPSLPPPLGLVTSIRWRQALGHRIDRSLSFDASALRPRIIFGCAKEATTDSYGYSSIIDAARAVANLDAFVAKTLPQISHGYALGRHSR